MHPAEGFSSIFTVTQQQDIERFMRYIRPGPDAQQSWSRASGPPTAGKHMPGQPPSTAQHMCTQPPHRSGSPQHWQPPQPHLHASSTPHHARNGSDGTGEHGGGAAAPQAGSQWWTAGDAAQQPSSDGKQHGGAPSDNDQHPAPQKTPKKKRKRGAGTPPSLRWSIYLQPLEQHPSQIRLPTVSGQQLAELVLSCRTA